MLEGFHYVDFPPLQFDSQGQCCSTHRVVEVDFSFLRFEPNSAIFFFKNCVRVEERLKKLESLCATLNIALLREAYMLGQQHDSSGGWNNGHTMLWDSSVKFGRKLL